MKLLSYFSRINKKSGIILIVVLWILLILSIFALSLGRKTNLELALVKNSIRKAKAKYIAWAGIVYAISNIQKDTLDKDSFKEDTSYFCGIKRNSNVTPEMLFKHREVRDGYFDIYYSQANDSFREKTSKSLVDDKSVGNSNVSLNYETNAVEYRKEYYGMSDEERKININALMLQDYKILSNLVVYLGYDKDIADTIAASVLDWKDSDNVITNGSYGAETEYYESLENPYHCKNAYFDSIEEIMLVRGMTKEIFHSMKDYITVFPKQDRLHINFDTATKPVMYSLARAVAELSPTADDADADSLIDKLLEYKNGNDGIEYTEDDNVIKLNDIAPNAVERNIFLSMNRYRIRKSAYINVKVRGVDARSNVMYNINAIILRNDMSIVYWHVY